MTGVRLQCDAIDCETLFPLAPERGWQRQYNLRDEATKAGWKTLLRGRYTRVRGSNDVEHLDLCPDHAKNSFFFGAPWPSGVCEDGVQVRTPVGEMCLCCEEAIGETHQGSLMLDGKDGLWRPTHRECQLRAVIGGIGHLQGDCSCHGGTGDPDAGLSYRRSAVLVWEWVQEHGVPA